MRRALLLILALPLAAALGGDPAIGPDTWKAWRAKIVPSEEELSFERLGWKPSFYQALREAQEKDRPVLLWAMNGHPLGCT